MRKFSPHLTARHKLFIMLFDVIVFILAAREVYLFRLGSLPGDIFVLPIFWLILSLVLTSLYVFNTYEVDIEPSAVKLSARTLGAIVVAGISVVLLNYFFAQDRDGFLGRGILAGTLIIFGCVAIFARVCAVHFFGRFRSDGRWLLIVEDAYLPFFESDIRRRHWVGQMTVLTESGTRDGRYQDVESFLDRPWTGVISALNSERMDSEIGQTLVQAKLAGHNVMGLSQFYEQHWGKVPVYILRSEWFITADSFKLIYDPIALRVKRLTDLLFSSLLLLITWPLMLVVAIAVRLEDHAPVIYKQVRTGKDGRPFTIYKFRSMVQNAEQNGAQWAQQSDSRVTRVGSFIRAVRLDELPQLFNVFKGDMSFIGPRPERPEFNQMLEKEIPYYGLRHLVRPGVTGWAQVRYPYGASIEDSREKLQYDIYYMKHYSILLDVLIFLRTIRVIIFHEGR